MRDAAFVFRRNGRCAGIFLLRDIPHGLLVKPDTFLVKPDTFLVKADTFFEKAYAFLAKPNVFLANICSMSVCRHRNYVIPFLRKLFVFLSVTLWLAACCILHAVGCKVYH